MIEANNYKGELLCQILHVANKSETPLELIKEENFHVKYLNQYLGETGLNAKFYLLEEDYISVDYLADHSFYYSKSFKNYGNKCVRLHFFTYVNDNNKEFNNLLNKSILKGNKKNISKDFWDKYYLGFIVVRPIPVYLIGYTILKHYNFSRDSKSFDSFRNYWGVKDYEVHVYGSLVKVESLAFMSQDSNVSACATIAIWCMMQIAVENYYINLKSPNEITTDSGLTVTDGNRMFPNNGLDSIAICNAITKSNLHPEIRYFEKNSKDTNYRIRKYVKAYSKIKLPIILGLEVPNNGKHSGHAVAICGHHSNENYFMKSIGKIPKRHKSETCKDVEFLFEDIDKLYTHDDQWGPFAKFEFVGANQLSTSWTLHTAESKNSIPIALIIPVFPKVRIPYEDIEEYLEGIRYLMKGGLSDVILGEPQWDIQLYFSSEFKIEIQNSGMFDLKSHKESDILLKILSSPLPKYIWVATFYIKGSKILHFIFDATGLRYTNNLLSVFSYYPPVVKNFTKHIRNISKKSSPNYNQMKSYLEDTFSDSIDGFIQKLNHYNY